MSTSEYASIERVFRLLFMLGRAGVEGYTRQEIFDQIKLYDTNDTKRATARMFERDPAFLEKLGFVVERTRKGRNGATYRIIHAEQLFANE